MSRDELQPWETLSTKVLFRHRFHPTVIEDQVRLPSGEELTWVRWEHAYDIGGAICLDQYERVLISWQWSHGPRKVVDEFPGGGLLEGETPEEAVRRELAEETGLTAGSLEYIGAFLTNNRKSPRRHHVFVARDLTQGKASPERGEIIYSEWREVEEVDRMIAAGELTNSTLLASWAIFRSR